MALCKKEKPILDRTVVCASIHKKQIKVFEVMEE
jgi:hypothetical protein